MLVEFENITNEGSLIRHSDEMKQVLSNVEGVSSTYRLWITCENNEVNAFAYDESIVSAFCPEIKSGIWLSETEEDSYIPVVVSHNSYGWEVGDIIEMQAPQLEEDTVEYPLRIVGVLEKNAPVFMAGMGSNQDNFYDLFWTYSDSYEEMPLLLFREEDIRDTDIFYIMNGTMLINYDGIEDVGYQQNFQTLYNTGEVSHVTNYSLLYKESKKVIRRELKVYLPIIALLATIALISIVHATELNLSVCMPDFAIFFQNGMSVGKGRFIATMTQVMSMLVSFAVSLGLAMYCLGRLKVHTSAVLLSMCMINAGFMVIAGILTYVKVTWICNRNSLVRLIRWDLS